MNNNLSVLWGRYNQIYFELEIT